MTRHFIPSPAGDVISSAVIQILMVYLRLHLYSAIELILEVSMDLEKTPIWPFYNMYIHFLSRLKPMSANLRVLSYNIQNP